MSERRIKDKEVRRIVEWAVKQLGFTLEHGRKHSKLHAPGQVGHVVFGHTHSCIRAAENMRHQIMRRARQAGIHV